MAELSDRGKHGIAVLVCLGVVGACLASTYINNPDQQPAPASPAPEQAPPPSSPTIKQRPNGAVDITIGNNGTLSTGAGVTDIAVDRTALNDLAKAAAAKDDDGYRRIISEGRAFTVPDGTKAKLIGVGGLFFDQFCQIRVLEGEHKGDTGWIPSEWLRKG